MKPKPRVSAALPTLLTLGNGACGFGAITIAAKIGPEAIPGEPSGPNLLAASLLVFLGMFFDMLDGTAARLTKSATDIGAQLDSLCDAVTFGVAPAFIMLQFARYDQLLSEKHPAWFTYPSRMVWTIGALYVVCAILRLARFNVETEEDDAHDGFSGLPSPAAAGAVVSFPVALGEVIRPHGADPMMLLWLGPFLVAALPLVTLTAAVLMVSRFPYPHVFSQLAQGGWRRRDVIGLVFGVAVTFWLHELAVMLLFTGFAASGPVKFGLKEVRERSTSSRDAAA